MVITKKGPGRAGILLIIFLMLSGCPTITNTKNGNQTADPSDPPTTPIVTGNRPTGNTGTGFFVADKKLFDANGVEFIINGVNSNHWWGTDSNIASIPNIKAANANAVRCVFGKRAAQGVTPDDYEEWYENANCYTTEQRQAVVEEYIKYHIVPIVEFHNATGSNEPAKVTEAVNFWISEPWVKTYEKYVIVNITNEWANSGNYVLWRDTYISAVNTLRTAGIKNTIIIDSIQWGQSIINASYYNAVFDADPEKNIVFSFHMYDGWVEPGDTDHIDEFNNYYHVDTGIQYLKTNLNAPVIAGEFNYLCRLTPADSCPDDILVSTLVSQNVGWLAWMWYNSTGNKENMVYSADSNVYTEFGKTITGFLKNSAEATIFTSSLPALPVVPVINPNPDWNPGGLSIRVFDISDGNPWWLEVILDNQVSNTTSDVSYVEMEVISTSEKIRMQYWTSEDNRPSFNVVQALSMYIGVNVRFIYHAVDGSVAKTISNTLVQGNSFGIDTSK